MARSTLLAIAGLGAGLFCMVGACGSDEPAKQAAPVAGQAGGTVTPMQAPAMSGRAATTTAGTTVQAAGAGAGGMGGQAGLGAGSGRAGQGAGSGGGAAAGMGGMAGAAGGAAEDDFFGLFDPAAPGALSCEGLLCLEAADCAALYPDETASCKFTKCEDFFCK